MRNPSALGLVLVTVLSVPTSEAEAWCQTLSVENGDPRCNAPCLTLADFTPEQIEAQRIVPLAWRQPCFAWTLHPRGTTDLLREQVLSIIEASFNRWNETTCPAGPAGFEFERRDIPDLLCAYPDFERGGRNPNTFVFARDWSGRMNDPRAFALTSVWFEPSTGEILGADVEFNDEGRQWAICPPEGCADGRVDLENVLVHELGHYFGLAHSPDDAEATMWACSDAGEVLKRDLAADDRAGFCALYGGGLERACEPPSDDDPPLTCTFMGASCGEPGQPRCAYCEDLGTGRVCTVPCDENPAVCGGGFECQPLGPEGVGRCVSVGCGCRVAGPQPMQSWPLIMALAWLVRRRR